MVEQQKLREYGASFRGHVWTIGPLEAKPWRIQRGERMDVVAVQSCPMPGSGKPLGKCTLEAMPIYTHRWPMSQRTEEIVRYFYEGGVSCLKFRPGRDDAKSLLEEIARALRCSVVEI